MFLSKKITVFVLLLVGIGGPVWAQRVGIKPDGFISRLRAGGQAYMVPNIQVGQETLYAGMLSRVGMARLTTADKLKYKAYELGQKHLSPAVLERLVARRLVKVPFPAYYMDFEKDWKEVKEEIQIDLRQLEVILEAAYGEETRFDGAFVTSYREVLELLQKENNSWAALGALKQAWAQARQKKSGFFVITVYKTEEHEHDVLLLDLKNKQFISVGQSIGEAWMKQHSPVQD